MSVIVSVPLFTYPYTAKRNYCQRQEHEPFDILSFLRTLIHRPHDTVCFPHKTGKRPSLTASAVYRLMALSGLAVARLQRLCRSRCMCCGISSSGSGVSSRLPEQEILPVGWIAAHSAAALCARYTAHFRVAHRYAAAFGSGSLIGARAMAVACTPFGVVISGLRLPAAKRPLAARSPLVSLGNRFLSAP